MAMKILIVRIHHYFSVCQHDNGLCNVNGITDCSTTSCECKPEYTGDQCEFCKIGTYVTNSRFSSNENGTLKKFGHGVECQCKWFTILQNTIACVNFFLTVCENLSGETCNINGVNSGCGPKSGNSCGTGSQSQCRQEYVGERCEMCAPQTYIYVSDGVNGTVDNGTSMGVICKCK